jgi:hypothetical protein
MRWPSNREPPSPNSGSICISYAWQKGRLKFRLSRLAVLKLSYRNPGSIRIMEPVARCASNFVLKMGNLRAKQVVHFLLAAVRAQGPFAMPSKSITAKPTFRFVPR